MNSGSRTLVTVLLAVLMAAGIFTGGFIVGRISDLAAQLPAAASPGAGPAGPAVTPGGSTTDREATFAPFWEAWDLVHREFVNQPVNDVTLMQGAISGMLHALDDPHSSYIEPEMYKIEVSDQSGELEGIGAYVESAPDGGLRIVSPFPGSPAEAAGLRPGDLVIAVDGQDVLDMDEFAIVNLVRGPAGSQVTLTVIREGEPDTLEFTITRAKITVPSVESEMLESGIAYIKINDFYARAMPELRQALSDLLPQNPKGIILDLRGNPGGLRDSAIEVAAEFLPRGTVVMKERYGDGNEVTYPARSGGTTDIPMVVLIDAGSASASEIVAGALQDYGRATIVGVTSYGKGSVQDWHALQGDNGAVRVTIALWYTPDGRSIHEQGITPDVTVELSEEDHTAGRDPQLDEAIRILTTGAAAP